MESTFHTGIRYGVSKKSAFVYPNSASDYLYFEQGTDPTPHLITVFEVSGKQMGTYELNADMKKISHSGYDKGIYYYICTSQSAISSGSFIAE